MSYPNSYSSSDSPIFVDPWPENRQTYLDTTLNDLESMLDDSAETVIFPCNDSSLHPQEPEVQQTTLFFTIFSPKNYRYYFIFEKFTLHFILALGTFSLPVKIGSLLLSHVLLKHNEESL